MDPPRKRKGKEIVEDIWSMPRQRTQGQTTVNTADQQPTAPFDYPNQIESPILRMPPQDSSNPNPFSSNPPLNQVTHTGMTQTSSHRGRRRRESLASDRQQQASGADQTYMIPPNQYNQIFNNTLQSQSSFPVQTPAPNCFPALQVPPAVSAEGGLLNHQPLRNDSALPILRTFIDWFSKNHTNVTAHSSGFGFGVLKEYLYLAPQEALSRLYKLHILLPLIINSLIIYFQSNQIYDIPLSIPEQSSSTLHSSSSMLAVPATATATATATAPAPAPAPAPVTRHQHLPIQVQPAAANVFNNQAAINNGFTTHNHSVRAPATRHQPLPIQVPPASANVINNQGAINNTLPTQNHSVPVTSDRPIPIQVPPAATGVVNNLVAISSTFPSQNNSVSAPASATSNLPLSIQVPPASSGEFNNPAGINNTFPSQNQSAPAPVTSYLPLPIQVPPASYDEFDYLPIPSVSSTQARGILELFVRGVRPNETILNEVFFLNLQRDIGLPDWTGLFHRYQTNGNSLQAVIVYILQYFQFWDTFSLL